MSKLTMISQHIISARVLTSLLLAVSWGIRVTIQANTRDSSLSMRRLLDMDE